MSMLVGLKRAGDSAQGVISSPSGRTNDFRGITYSLGSSSNTHNYITYSHASSVTDNINTNTFTNLVVNTTGSVTFISRAGNMTSTGVENCNGNNIVTGFNKTGAGGTVTLYTANASSVQVHP